MSPKAGYRFAWRVALLVGFFAVVMAVVLIVRQVDRPRVIVSAVAPDGTEMCLVQEFNWSPELFTTSFVYRKPQGRWSWFYFDHQDDYWAEGQASVRMTEKQAVFSRRGSPVVTFAWDRETYTLHRWDRTLVGTQGRLPEGWGPGMSTREVITGAQR